MQGVGVGVSRSAMVGVLILQDAVASFPNSVPAANLEAVLGAELVGPALVTDLRSGTGFCCAHFGGSVLERDEE